MSFDAYQMVTDKIVELMESGIIPWAKPWTSTVGGAWSGSTGKPYSLLNQILLLDTKSGKTLQEMREDASGEWLTFNQAKERGGCVRKGERGRKVVFFKTVNVNRKENGEEDEENPKMIPFLQVYTVFHIRQIDGVEQKYHKDERADYETEPLEGAERVAADYVKRSGLKVVYEKGDRAFYSPISDTVTVPPIKQYKEASEFYSTLFHEFTHSTGHPSRLDRKLVGYLADGESYSTEELVAEIGSASILAILGIDTDGSLRNSAGYIQGWLKALKNDKRMIVVASSRAEKAVRLILDVQE